MLANNETGAVQAGRRGAEIVMPPVDCCMRCDHGVR